MDEKDKQTTNKADNESKSNENLASYNETEPLSSQLNDLNITNDSNSKTFLAGFETLDFEFFDDEKLPCNEDQEKTNDKQQSSSIAQVNAPIKKIRKYAYKVAPTWVPNYELDFELPFVPDTFQLQSFYLLKHNKSILVTAHTSSGKTTIVDYAIHQCRLHKSKVIYTSPIKALSNQKYNEFKIYKPGIITGDVSLNTESDILIMTTEILRNLLYSRSNLLGNLEFVVFDEVHYINNRDRGVIWEECIIMLPKTITIIMLSACIPNAMEFGAWVGRVRESEIYVIETLKRVVPLEYYICEKEEIRALHKKAVKQQGNTKNSKQPPLTSVSKNIVSHRKKDNLLYITNYIVKHTLTPCIIFCFSKKKCHFHAKRILKPYIREFEKKKILEIIKTRFEDKIEMEDRLLPQIVEIQSLLINGIAVHHSGLLPILKELIEILFSLGLVKILFATETFSMGVNFPAKCVVFLSIKKMDDNLRVLHPGEFMQMSGRAGRRGIDKKGVVIVNYENERLDDNIEFIVNNLIKSRCALHSKFKLTYNMILQLLRCKVKVEDILKRSFCEDNVQKDMGKQIKLLSKMEQIYKNLTINRIFGDGTNESENYVLDCKLCKDIRDFVTSWKHFYEDNNEFIKYYVKSKNNFEDKVFVTTDMTEIKYDDLCDLPRTAGKYFIENIDFTDYYKDFVIYSKRYIINEKKKSYNVEDILYIKQGDCPFFDYDVINFDRTLKLIATKEIFEGLNTFVCNNCPDINAHYAQTIDVLMLEKRIDDVKKCFDTKSLILFEDYLTKIAFLIDHEYIDNDHNLMLKGRLACEIKTVDEIVITECLINNVFKDLPASEILAFVSMIITKEEDKQEIEDKNILKIIDNIKKTYDIEFYSVYYIPTKLWCEGNSFSEIIACHRVSEGIFIRTILRLDEFCREVLNCCTILDDKELYEKIDEVRKTLKRDIVSCSSLYFDA